MRANIRNQSGKAVNPGEKQVKELDNLFQVFTAQKLIQNAIISIENFESSFSWHRAVGCEEEQIQPGTPFFIASIDKLLNASIILMLMEQGELDLRAPISAYLPSGMMDNLHVYRGMDYSGQLTLRHLLSHTSGLADWLEDSPKDGRTLVEKILEEGDADISIEEIAAIVRNDLKPHFPPQNLNEKKLKVRYSDTNFILLIAIIEQVMGMPLHQVHEKFLYKPLDMRHTFFIGNSRPLDPTPQEVALRAQGKKLHIPKFLGSGRGIYSTSADLLIFMRYFVKGDLFSKPGTLQLMQENWNQFGFPLDRAAMRSPGWPIEYGLGLMRFQLPRVFSPFRPMPQVIGHTGSTGCWLFYCPEMDMLLTGSVDEVTAGAVPYRIIPKILNILGV